jgi:hypothetical protein
MIRVADYSDGLSREGKTPSIRSYEDRKSVEQIRPYTDLYFFVDYSLSNDYTIIVQFSFVKR